MGRGSSKVGGGGGGKLFNNEAFDGSQGWFFFKKSFGEISDKSDATMVENNYTGTGASFQLNKKLYDPNAGELTEKQKQTVASLDKLISQQKTPADAVYTRYADMKAVKGILGLNDSQMSQLLGISSFSESDMKLLNKAIGGAQTLSKGFNSTSAIKQHLFSHELFRREISVPKGTNAYCSSNKSEHEVIFGRNMKTTINHVSWDGKHIVLHERFIGYDS